MTNGDRNLRLAAFILNIISMVALGWTLLPLAWMSPMTVMSWGIYKGTRANTVAFGVCNLLFMNAIFFGGISILLLKILIFLFFKVFFREKFLIFQPV